VNDRKNAKPCLLCATLRASLGAAQPRLALWCHTCASEADRLEQLCRTCLARARESQCSHCQKKGVELIAKEICAESECSARIHLCHACVPITRGERRVQCGTCWSAAGEICIFCSTHPAQHHLKKYRGCKLCIQKRFCRKCMLPPALDAVTTQCHMSHSLAAWCEKDCDVTELASGLCPYHFVYNPRERAARIQEEVFDYMMPSLG
jgi:hypothetical protein